MQTFQLIIFRLSGVSEQPALDSASTLLLCKAICKLIIQYLDQISLYRYYNILIILFISDSNLFYGVSNIAINIY